MTAIEYVSGDATRPVGDGCKVIVHICNDRGGWGKGFVLALSKRWKQPEAAYRNWYSGVRARYDGWSWAHEADLALGACPMNSPDDYIKSKWALPAGSLINSKPTCWYASQRSATSAFFLCAGKTQAILPR